MNEQPDLHMPPPSYEPSQPEMGQMEFRPEQMPNPEMAHPSVINPVSNNGLASALPPLPSSLFPTSPVAIPTSGPIVNGSQSSTKDHNDHMEVQYIEKIKKIIATTQGDPYVRTKELNKTKVEFLDRKYGKKLKVSDD
jgi:hypothetical protein